MTLILWIARTASVDIGEQKIYKDCLSIEHISDDNNYKIRIKFLLAPNMPREHCWMVADVIKMEVIP